MHGLSVRTRTPTAGGRAARASGCRGRLPLALALAAIIGLVSTLLIGRPALADSQYTTVLYHSTLQGGSQWIVGAWNKYDAAAMICGKSMSEIQGFDLVVRGKLSTNGGKFQELAESLDKDWPGWNEDTLNGNLEETFGVDLWQAMQGLSLGAGGVGFNPDGLSVWQVKWWQDNCDTDIYAANVTADLVSQATADMNTILNGGNLGGGGAVTDLSTFVAQPYCLADINSNYYVLDSTNGKRCFFVSPQSQLITSYGYYAINSPITVTVASSNLQNIANDLPGGYDTYAYLMITGTGGKLGVKYVSLPSDSYELVNETDELGNVVVTGFHMKTTGTVHQHYFRDSTTYTYAIGGTLSFTKTNQTFYHGTDTVSANSNYVVVQNYEGGIYATPLVSGGGGGGGGNDWPEPGPTPTPTPDPPEVPEPPDIQLPEPGDPVVDPQIPTEPTTNVQDPVNAPDYTLWLVAILAQLRVINDSLAQHCVHLQQEIWDNGTRVTNSIIARANSLEHTLIDGNNAMMDYLYDLFHWLAERMNFDNSVYVEPYNDSSVLYWLKRIYSKLTNDAPDIRQPDTEEPFDFWAWLLQLVSDTIGGIIGDLVGDLAGLLENFTDKFPFSIPWDIAALLALLDAQRATPVFVVTIPAVSGWWPQQNYTIDLTPYNGVASVARTMINIWWLLVLAMKTDWMLLIMGDSASLGARFVRKISGGAA